MDAQVLLADFAQVDGSGKVGALGLGWSVTTSPTPPHAVIVMFHVGWDETNTKHAFLLALLDADGQQAVSAPGPLGTQPLRADGEFEVGRPPGLPKGSSVDHSIALNVPQGLPLAPGRYEWRLTINGDEARARTASFSVMEGQKSSP